MEIRRINRWDVTYSEAVEIQKVLQEEVVLAPVRKKVAIIAGADISYNKGDDRIYAGVVILSYPGFEIVEKHTAVAKAAFPYIPGLLSFREVPPLLEVFRMVETVPDVILCDGQGIAHPRRFGMASHLGLFLGLPTVGCAKSLLVGEFREPGRAKGRWSELSYHGETVGSAVRTREGVKPVFVSPGHLIDIPSARKMALAASASYRIPEPVRQAHILVNQLRKGKTT
ncbi:MAG TPA: deoxyribonuclease V [bacterium]|nr:deoxyribonuclease V [bacterium]